MKFSYLITRYLSALIITVCLLVLPTKGHSEEIIASIRVEGAQRIDTDTVLSYIELAEGDEFSVKSVRASVKALYETGYFKDIAFNREDNVLVVVVKENPIVNDITFSGNKNLSDEDLEEIIKLQPNTIYTRSRTKQDLALLQQAYRSKGMFLAKIDIEVDKKDNNQVNLVFKIKEGDKSTVREVRVIGNKNISDEKLLDDLMIQATDWLSWYTDDNTYEQEKLYFDQSQIKNIYLDAGYINVSVDSSIAELTPDRSAFIVTHTVREGKRFRLGDITLQGNFDELPEEELYKELTIAEGEWYSRQQIKFSINKLNDRIGDFGYAFLKINVATDADTNSQIVNLAFNINKGRRVYVNRIKISGNTRTRDEVIRRKVSMVEGDIFSASNLRRTRARINSLNFFKNIKITNPISSDPDKVDLNIEVEEKPTGAFTVGAGYSSAEGFLATASVSQNNFLGRGQKLALSFSLSADTQNYNLSFTEPYFLGKNLSAGFDIFKRTTEPTSSSSYETDRVGVGARLGFPISHNLYNTVSYRISKVEVNNTGTSFSRLIQAQADSSPYLQSMISNALSWNNVDNNLTPTSGRIHKLFTDFSGLGGDVKFARLVSEHQLYWPISDNKKWVGHLTGRVGYTQGILGEDLPIYERFQLGGTGSIRGFKRGGLGPRTNLNEAYGGTMYELANAEIIFPIYGLTEKGVSGFIFTDAAHLHDPDLPSDVTDDETVRASIGAGISWNSPFGPLKMIWATPLIEGDNDQTRIFDFSMGAAF
ncbi:MAG: outer membrane protein assembly factor BamA [Magnetococcales bacterium]|nr:outer membrane protein assembly factor BamA [Magnetococcales bacterium]